MSRCTFLFGPIFILLAVIDNGCGGTTDSGSSTSTGGTPNGTGGASGQIGGSGPRGGGAGRGGAGNGAGHEAGGGGAAQLGGSTGRGGGGPTGGSAGKAGGAQGGSIAHVDGGPSGKGGWPESHADGAVDSAIGGHPADGSSDSGPMGAGGSSDRGADASTPDASTPVSYDASTLSGFEDILVGTWLIGWSAGVRHYSWVRIKRGSTGGTGVAQFLSGEDLGGNDPYWNCSGSGTWDIPQKPRSILFTFPASCTKPPDQEYTFENFSSSPQYPPGAILSASVIPLSGGPSTLNGYKVPDTTCDATMSSCSNLL